MLHKTMLVVLAGSGLAIAHVAQASPVNQPPPAGPVILNLNGTPVPHTYTNYTVSFVAAATVTNLSFAFREDPAFLSLDDVTLNDVTHPGPNLVLNGGFELGPVGASAPTDWTYLNIFGAQAAGIVDNNNPHTGTNNYYDGAVQAYDSITQAIATTVGDNYRVSFFLDDNSGLTTFSSLSTNGDTTDTGGNGIDVLVYAGALPTRAVPEPTSLALLGTCFAGFAALRRRRRV